MSQRLFPSPDVPAVPVAGEDALFPVHRIFCVGRNYAAHAAEMGAEVDREAPFYFTKSAFSLAGAGTLPYPPGTGDYHHEVELVVALSTGGRDIAADRALDHVWGYGVGLDMTRRDLQGEAKKMGRPWEVGKSFEKSGPCGPLVPASRIASIRRSGMPHSPNPPTAIVIPSRSVSPSTAAISSRGADRSMRIRNCPGKRSAPPSW